MNTEELHNRLRADLAQTKAHFRDLQNVLLALWKGGIPSRFWLFLFVTAVVLGVGTKAWAMHHITIGHDDYTLQPASRLYDLNAVQANVLAKGGALTQPTAKKEYPACTANDTL